MRRILMSVFFGSIKDAKAVIYELYTQHYLKEIICA